MNNELEMYQKFPMQMMLKYLSNDDGYVFEAKFSQNDIFNNAGIPLFIWVELMGQAAERSMRLSGSDEKKYLVQVNNMDLNARAYLNPEDRVLINVKRVQSFGKMAKNRVSVMCGDMKYVEGDFVHINI